MATKDRPGAFDCHEALANDEPYFLLRANDPCAPLIVRLWARRYVEKKMVDREGSDPEKVFAKHDEAALVALKMEEWYETRLLPCTKCGLPRNDHLDDQVAHRWTAEQQEVAVTVESATAQSRSDCPYVLCKQPETCAREERCVENRLAYIPAKSSYAGLDRQSKDEDPPSDGAIGPSIYG